VTTEPERGNSGRPRTASDYLAQMDHLVPGWFNEVDGAVFLGVDEVQRSLGITGELLEIGVFLGKSAVLLGYLCRPGETLVVADLFSPERLDSSVDTDAGIYEGLTESAFRQNYQRFHDVPPTVIAGSSTELLNVGLGRRFRIVHIDGSHRYEIVRGDIATALGLLVDGGIVVLDDYRTLPHALGVALAFWEAVIEGALVPVLATQGKIYACAAGTAEATAARFRDWGLEQSNRPAVRQDVAGHEIVVFEPLPTPPPARMPETFEPCHVGAESPGRSDEPHALRQRLALIDGSRTWRLRNRVVRLVRRGHA